MYGLPDGLLRQKFSVFETKKFTLIFGSCYSGGMFDDLNVDLRAPGRVICSASKANQYGWDYLRLVTRCLATTSSMKAVCKAKQMRPH